MRIEWVRILPRGVLVIISFQWFSMISMMIIEQLLQSPLISTSKLRVSLKTGSRVFTFGEQNFENSKSTIISTPPSLWFSFSWQAAQIRWTSGSARKGLGKSHNDHPSHGDHRSGSQSESGNVTVNVMIIMFTLPWGSWPWSRSYRQVKIMISSLPWSLKSHLWCLPHSCRLSLASNLLPEIMDHGGIVRFFSIPLLLWK